MIELLNTDQDLLRLILDRLQLAAGIAAVIAPIVILVIEAITQAVGKERFNGIIKIGTSVLVGVLIGLAVPAIGIGIGALAGAFAVAGVTVVRNVGVKAAQEAAAPTPQVPVIGSIGHDGDTGVHSVEHSY